MIFENNDKIIFAGDSVTDMESAQPVGEAVFDSLGKGYVRLIDSILTSLYPELVIRVVNSGMSGNSSRDLLERYERDVISLKPDWVSICIGINDVFRQFIVPAQRERHVHLDEYEENLEKMIMAVKPNVKGIFICTPYYMEPNKDDFIRNMMDNYCEVCRRLAEKHGCIFVDFQTMYENYCKIRHSSYIAWDRVHPNQTGAMLMAIEFLKKCGIELARK